MLTSSATMAWRNSTSAGLLVGTLAASRWPYPIAPEVEAAAAAGAAAASSDQPIESSLITASDAQHV
jgi:hypothetical protein